MRNAHRTFACISIRQPWASAIIAGYKGIENRTWKTHLRGQLLIHASKTVDRSGYAEIVQLVGEATVAKDRFTLESLPTGGIIGWVNLSDVVKLHHSPWFIGPYGWVLTDPHALPFVAYKGKQTLFRVPIADLYSSPSSPNQGSLFS